MSETKLQDWQLIDWKYVEGDVRNLRQQIFVASHECAELLERECYESSSLRSEGRLSLVRGTPYPTIEVGWGREGIKATTALR